ncbi:MAG TPA: hypothetical protein VNK48_01575 [Xanthobacteraceae bacterium]|nr:hypothetical protein [Xanthobacteraceae bacterium]
MSEDRIRQNRRLSNRLHPRVYTAMAVLAGWIAVAVWAFGTDGYTDYLLAIVSGFIFIVVALAHVLSRVGTRDPGARVSDRTESSQQDETFHDWALGELDTWQDRVRASNAAVEVLLPMAAIAFGMTAIGIVYLFVHSTS